MIVAYAVDVGSIKNENFAWARQEENQPKPKSTDSTDIEELAKSVIEDIKAKYQVALGFECPLFIPVAKKPAELLKSRHGEGSRPWSAGAGPYSMAAGLAESAWLLKRIAESGLNPRATHSRDSFSKGDAEIFLWEAFVTKKEILQDDRKLDEHFKAACIALDYFWRSYRNKRPSRIELGSGKESLSLISSVAEWAGLSLIDENPIHCEVFVPGS